MTSESSRGVPTDHQHVWISGAVCSFCGEPPFTTWASGSCEDGNHDWRQALDIPHIAWCARCPARRSYEHWEDIAGGVPSVAGEQERQHDWDFDEEQFCWCGERIHSKQEALRLSGLAPSSLPVADTQFVPFSAGSGTSSAPPRACPMCYQPEHGSAACAALVVTPGSTLDRVWNNAEDDALFADESPLDAPAPEPVPTAEEGESEASVHALVKEAVHVAYMEGYDFNGATVEAAIWTAVRASNRAADESLRKAREALARIAYSCSEQFMFCNVCGAFEPWGGELDYSRIEHAYDCEMRALTLTRETTDD